MPGLGTRTGLLFRDQEAPLGNLGLEVRVFRRINGVDAARQHRKGAGFHCTDVGCRIDATGQSGHDGKTRFSQLRGKRSGVPVSGAGSVPGADDRDGGAVEQIALSSDRDQGWRIRQRGQRPGIRPFAVHDQPGAQTLHGLQFGQGLLLAVYAEGRLSPAAGEARQGFECSRRRTVPLDQMVVGDGADVLAAHQAKTRDTPLVVEFGGRRRLRKTL